MPEQIRELKKSDLITPHVLSRVAYQTTLFSVPFGGNCRDRVGKPRARDMCAPLAIALSLSLARSRALSFAISLSHTLSLSLSLFRSSSLSRYPPKVLRGGISKVKFQETLSSFGDKCLQNGSKTAPTAPRPHLGCPHEGSRVGFAWIGLMLAGLAGRLRMLYGNLFNGDHRLAMKPRSEVVCSVHARSRLQLQILPKDGTPRCCKLI